MQITRDNYERWFLDYLEGRLSRQQRRDVERFMKANPDLEAEMEEFDTISLPKADVHYPHKYKHKKPMLLSETEASWLEEQCIAYKEEDLSATDKQGLEELAARIPEVRQTINDYQNTTLPCTDIAYPHKKALKRTRILSMRQDKARTVTLQAVAAAAVLLLLVTFGTLWMHRQHQPVLQQAQRYTQEIPELPETASTHPVLQRAKLAKPPLEERNILTPKQTAPVPKNVTLVEAEPQLPELKMELIPMEFENLVDNDRNSARNPDNPYMEEVDRIISKRLAAIREEPHTLTLSDYLDKRLFNNKLKETSKSLKKDGLWALAEYSVKGLRKLTGKDIKIEREVDEAGKTTRIAFQANNFVIEKTMH